MRTVLKLKAGGRYARTIQHGTAAGYHRLSVRGGQSHDRASAVHAALVEGGRKVSSATVYRQLEKLVLEGVVVKSQESEFNAVNVFGKGSPNAAFAQYFSGESFLNPLTDSQNGEFPLFNVTFEPGCRNNWHAHHAKSGGGQILICTAGEGWYQEEGEAARELIPGTVVVVPAGVKHWHGAKADSWFSHIAIEVPGEDCSNEWLEPVDDAAFAKLG